MKPKIFIDGEHGTTGLQIRTRLAGRDDIEVISIPVERRKDTAARQDFLQAADIAILCLPDDAAKESVALIGDADTRVIDASTAHRVASGWTYGFPEMDREQAKKIADLADLFQMPVCAHCHASPLAFMASAHCAASIRNFKAQEHSVGPFEDIWEKLIVPHEPLIKDGFIQLTDTPGLGIELNEDYMRNNLAPNEVWWGNAS